MVIPYQSGRLAISDAREGFIFRRVHSTWKLLSPDYEHIAESKFEGRQRATRAEAIELKYA